MTLPSRVKLKPGDTIGILGGGQLGRMLATAAARLGLRCRVFSPDPDSPAFDVVANATCAEYADVEALELFAADVDVITYEFENVPAASAMILAARRPVLPDRKILETSYNNEVKAMEPRFDIRPEALQAILDELAVNDPRAKKIQPQQLIDRRYLEEMERSGFFDSLWGGKR